MNQKHILFPYLRIFQPPFLPQNFPLLPTSPPSYLPHLISCSFHLQSSRELLSLSSTKFWGDVDTRLEEGGELNVEGMWRGESKKNISSQMRKKKGKFLPFYHNPSLGLVTKAGLEKVWAKSEAWESHFMLPKVQENVREWTLTLPSELPLWELEFEWIFKFSEINYRGQDPLDWRVPYIIEKLLKLKCLKWPCMTHLDTQHTSYGQKKGQESNCQFDSRPLKVKNHIDFLVCWWRTTHLKSFWQGL